MLTKELELKIFKVQIYARNVNKVGAPNYACIIIAKNAEIASEKGSKLFEFYFPEHTVKSISIDDQFIEWKIVTV